MHRPTSINVSVVIYCLSYQHSMHYGIRFFFFAEVNSSSINRSQTSAIDSVSVTDHSNITKNTGIMIADLLFFMATALQNV